MDRKNFKLIQVKLSKDGGANATFFRPASIGYDKVDIESDVEIHEDFRVKVKSLSEFVMSIARYNDIKVVVQSDLFKASDSQKRILDKTLLELQHNIEVTGLKMTGEEANRKVTITYNLKQDNEQVKGSSTHPIFVERNDLGYESEVGEIADDIEQEVFEYLFEDKKAQETLFDQRVDPNDSEDESEEGSVEFLEENSEK